MSGRHRYSRRTWYCLEPSTEYAAPSRFAYASQWSVREHTGKLKEQMRERERERERERAHAWGKTYSLLCEVGALLVERNANGLVQGR